MAEEVPFTPLKITLSEEATKRLAELRLRGSFRSDSATIEECIRVIHEVSNDMSYELDNALGKNQLPMPLFVQAELLKRILQRIARFGFITPRMQKYLITTQQ